MSRIKVYLASSWFTPATEEIRSNLETLLSARDDIELYSPRRDGIMLPPNQKHDTAVRESIFHDNIKHITESDLVIANIYSGDSYNDPGTMYEIGYAMAHNVPVVGFTTKVDNVRHRFQSILRGMEVITEYKSLTSYLNVTVPSLLEDRRNSTVLFVGNGNKEIDEKLVAHIMDSGVSIRWINNSHEEIYTKIDDIFKDVKYMIVVVDDRKTLSSWMIGQAYARGIQIVTYSDFNYGINVMLLVSILTHLRGTDELDEFLQQVNRYGIESIPKFDISQLDSM